ncbi:MAG: SDR family oxidoreductase, partial [Gammaproteobacteria bacterium]|nr:SDR family oxidoreductase [Gammaproteobacteria bacterium]
MKAAIVTGGSAGIGLATAERFADAGFGVVNLSRRPCPLPSVQHIPCDLSDPLFLHTVQRQLGTALGGADEVAMIHNASRLENDSAAETADQPFRDVMQINVLAINSLNRWLIPRMGAGSCILFVGSTLSEKAVP